MAFSKLDFYKSHFDVDSYLNKNLILHNPFDNYESSQLRGVTSKFLLYGGPSCHPAPQFVEAPNFL